MRSLVTFIFLYACESWTLTAELQRRIQAIEMRYYLKMLRVSYKRPCYQPGSPCQDPAGNRTVLRPDDGKERDKLQWYGRVSHSSGLAKTSLQGTVKGGRRQGRQRKRWEDNIREWTGLEFAKSRRAVENTEEWKKLVAKSSVVPQRPSQLRDR